MNNHHEALFHAAWQRQFAPGPDLQAFETERQLVEANRWDHAPVPRGRLLELNTRAADYFSQRYPDSWGPAYVTGRLGTDLADQSYFRPGYAPAGWTHLCEHLRALGAGDQEILAAGLGRVAGTGRMIDQFRGRLVLPIRNGEQIHGFIGRRHPALGDHGAGGPKYLNTPRTDLFDKGAQLFGLREGRAALDAGAAPVLVEGSFDAIAVTLGTGGRYVGLASLGTCITATQANLLGPYAGDRGPGVTVATDADLAGEIGAHRAFWTLAARGHTPRLALLPEGQDPAEVLARGGPVALLACLDDARPLAEQLLDERLDNLGADPRVMPACAAIIAAQPPGTWAEQISYAEARGALAGGRLGQAVAEAARGWSLDPLGCAQAQIGDLWAVRTRLQQAGHLRRSAGRPSDPGPSTGLGTQRPPASGRHRGARSQVATAPTPATQTLSPAGGWIQLAGSISPELTAGDDWPILQRAIQEADTAGYDVARGLARLAAEARLSPTHPAAELAYRLRAATTIAGSDIEPPAGTDPKPAALSRLARSEPNTRAQLQPPGRPLRRSR